MNPISKLSKRQISANCIEIYDINLEAGLIYDERDRLTGLDLSKVDAQSTEKLEVGGIIRVGPKLTPFKISKMEYIDGLVTTYQIAPNNSVTFLTPMLFSGRGFLRWSSNFVSTFVNITEQGYEIQLLYRFEGTTSFASFEKFLNDHPEFIEQEDVDNYHTLYSYKVPPEFEDDFLLVLQGKYSQTSVIYKQRVMDFHMFQEDGTMAKIFSRNKELRHKIEDDLEIPRDTLDPRTELHEIFNLSKEQYLEKYKIKRNALKDPVG